MGAWSELLVPGGGQSQRPTVPVPRGYEPSAPEPAWSSRAPQTSEGEGIHHPNHHNVPQCRYDGNPEQDRVVGGPRRLFQLALAVGGRMDVGGGVKEGVLRAEVLVGRVHEGASHHGQLRRGRERINLGAWGLGRNRLPEGHLQGQATPCAHTAWQGALLLFVTTDSADFKLHKLVETAMLRGRHPDAHFADGDIKAHGSSTAAGHHRDLQTPSVSHASMGCKMSSSFFSL